MIFLFYLKLDLGCKGAFAFIEESSSLLAIKAWGNKGM